MEPQEPESQEFIELTQTADNATQNQDICPTLLETNFDAILILTLLGKIVQCNKAAESVFCCQKKELITKNIIDLLSCCGFMMKPGQLRKEVIHFKGKTLLDNNAIQLDCRAKIFIYKKKEHILLVLRDISDLLQKEEDLKRSKNFAARIAECSPVVLFLTDKTGQLTYFNELWYKWTGFAFERHRGYRWMTYIAEEDRELFRKIFAECLAERKILDVDIRLQLPCGQRWVNLHAEPCYDEDDSFEGLTGSMMDITARKFAESTLYLQNQTTQDQLTNLVRERTAELEKRNNELMQFSSIASHDLKEPVRKISIFGRILLEQIKRLHPDHRRRLQKIVDSADRMTKLIHDLLTFSRLTHIQQSLFEITSLQLIAANVIDDMDLQIKEKAATITISPLPEIKCIPFQISQVFQNLISNSLKFADEARPLAISIKAEPTENNCIKILYEDTGIGFGENDAEKIFEIFQRLHPRDKYEGTGIGLSIVRKIISLHRGEIYASGEPGKGAKFMIFLPLGPDEPAPGSPLST